MQHLNVKSMGQTKEGRIVESSSRLPRLQPNGNIQVNKDMPEPTHGQPKEPSLPDRVTRYKLEVEKVVREVGEHSQYELKRGCAQLADKVEFVKDVQSICTSRTETEVRERLLGGRVRGVTSCFRILAQLWRGEAPGAGPYTGFADSHQ